MVRFHKGADNGAGDCPSDSEMSDGAHPGGSQAHFVIHYGFKRPTERRRLVLGLADGTFQRANFKHK